MLPVPRYFPVLLVLLAVVAAWSLGLWSDFPYFYHTDEPGKARQIIEGTRNLHHPLLMLESTALAVKAFGVPLEPQAVTETGRCLSAWFSALSAVLLVVTLARFRAWPVALLAGVLLVLQPDVQEYSRFFKEDPSLMFGWACVFASMAWFEKRPGVGPAVVLGAAVAVAASGKYVGIVMLLPALFLAVMVLRREKAAAIPLQKPLSWPVLLGALFVSMVLVFAVINLRMLLDTGTLRTSLTKETTLVLEGQGSVRKSIPHGGFFERLFNRCVHLLPFVAIGWWTMWRERRSMGWTPLLLLLSPWALALLLAFSAKDSGRYFMPANLGLAAAAAVGVGNMARFFRDAHWRRRVAVAGAMLVMTGSTVRCLSYFEGFRSDARKEMLLWIGKNLPGGSKIIQGRKVCLPDSEGKFADAWHVALPAGLRLSSVNLVSEEAASPMELAKAGFTHVALAGDEYEVYLKDHKAKEGKADERRRRREFYLALFKEGKIVWDRPSGKVGTHQPPLRLVELPAP